MCLVDEVQIIKHKYIQKWICLHHLKKKSFVVKYSLWPRAKVAVWIIVFDSVCMRKYSVFKCNYFLLFNANKYTDMFGEAKLECGRSLMRPWSAPRNFFPFWQTIRQLRQRKQHLTKDVLTSTDDVIGWWKEHFECLLNPTGHLPWRKLGQWKLGLIRPYQELRPQVKSCGSRAPEWTRFALSSSRLWMGLTSITD